MPQWPRRSWSSSGTVPLTALLCGLVPERFRRVGVIVTGGNLDLGMLAGLASVEADASGPVVEAH